MKIVIVGAGIGGLTCAASLHAVGFQEITVLEAARDIRPIGVGINLPPHAVRELVELGLGEGLAEFGIPTAELAYFDIKGQLIHAEERGLAAGYHWPQYSVNRGRLQVFLLNAVVERLGCAAVATDRRVTGIEKTSHRYLVRAQDYKGQTSEYEADVVIGADGIRSIMRTMFSGATIPLATNGWTMFRGATISAPFRGGRSMAIIGDEQRRCVIYPIEPGVLNWLMVRPTNTSDAEVELGNWNRTVNPEIIASYVEDWDFDWLDIPALIRRTDHVYEYPMVDIDPLSRWTFGNTTLLGDAAHAMYPFGSNGASQAIIDARVLAYCLATKTDSSQALTTYEKIRRDSVSAVQLANRHMSSNVMKRIGELARSRNHAGAATELEKVEQSYRRVAGFDVATLNTRPSWSVLRG